MYADQDTQDDLDLIVLVGPTAVGKTDVAVILAERLDAEIINADSMQVYIGMNVGTAKPDALACNRARFHLLDCVRPDQPYSVADWKRGAESALAEIRSRGKRAILCGGTGMYVRALLDGWTLAETPADPQIRERLRHEAQVLGPLAMHARLREIDPVTALRLHPNDLVRIERALEVTEITGMPISRFQERDQATQHPHQGRRFGLSLPRLELNHHIDLRVDAMLRNGLETEVRELYAQGYGPDLAPLRSLGYREIGLCLSGEIARDEAIRAIKQNTHRFAKRQMTWFRSDRGIQWIEVSALSSATVANRLEEALHGNMPS